MARRPSGRQKGAEWDDRMTLYGGEVLGSWENAECSRGILWTRNRAARRAPEIIGKAQSFSDRSSMYLPFSNYLKS